MQYFLLEAIIPFIEGNAVPHLACEAQPLLNTLSLLDHAFFAGADEAIAVQTPAPPITRARLIDPGELTMHALPRLALDAPAGFILRDGISRGFVALDHVISGGNSPPL